MNIKAVILDEKAIQRATTRIANEIIERNKGIVIILLGLKLEVSFCRRLSKKK